MDYYRWLYSLSKRYFHLFLFALLGSLIQSAGATGITLLVKGVVDNVFILKNESEVLKIVILLLLSAVVMQVGFFISAFTLSYVSERIVKNVRERIYKNLLNAPLNFFISKDSGDLISRIVSDLESLKQVFNDYIPKILREPVVALALLGVLIYRDFVLTLSLLLFFPVMYILTRYFSSKKKKYLKRQRENVSVLAGVLNESFKGIENIKSFIAESKFIESFRKFSEKFFKSSVKINFYVVGNTVLNYIFGYSVVALILLFGSYRIVQGSITPGDFISFLTAVFMIQKPIMEIQKAIMNIRGSSPLYERINFLLNVPQEKSGSLKFEGFNESIRFENVSLKVNGYEILKDINLEVKRGDKVGIKGHTGSGKSTLVRLLPRMYEYEGKIFIDGVELRGFELKSLREKIGFSTQEVILFKGTVRDNLLLAKEDATEEEMILALRLARCDFILENREGLDTKVEEGGLNFSGGERQRLALARIFLKNPEILILDEATSALDPATEREVLENIFSYFRDKTIFVIAHRESNLEYCNAIVEMEGGRIRNVISKINV